MAILTIAFVSCLITIEIGSLHYAAGCRTRKQKLKGLARGEFFSSNCLESSESSACYGLTDNIRDHKFSHETRNLL